ncbi:MAG: hypothetical protein C0467_05175 [Planctomycetaceae bacterium]|nr:hypothetical protein [Planctomycetaceae bacterium]
MDPSRDDSPEDISLEDVGGVNPEFAFCEVLRRAFRHGKRSQSQFNLWTFAEVETDLRAGWQLNGETTAWSEVRDSVRAGFEAVSNEIITS